MEHSFGPYLEIARIQSEMNKMFEVLVEMKNEAGDTGSSSWIPSVDVCEDSEKLILRAELPGVPIDSVRVTAMSGALVITGNRPRTEPGDHAKFHCMERSFGKFRRVVPLGLPINTRDANAVLKNGILSVHFPKVSNRRGEEVEIPVAAAEDDQ